MTNLANKPPLGLKADKTKRNAKYLDKIREIEKMLGREEKRIKNQPRTIDIDIVIFKDSFIDTSELQIPHPGALLRNFVLIISFGLVFGITILCSSNSVIFLYIAIFLLRLFGQGLMPHASMTSMTRYYSYDRGKAISISSLGLPLGEIALPTISIFLISV